MGEGCISRGMEAWRLVYLKIGFVAVLKTRRLASVIKSIIQTLASGCQISQGKLGSLYGKTKAMRAHLVFQISNHHGAILQPCILNGRCEMVY